MMPKSTQFFRSIALAMSVLSIALLSGCESTPQETPKKNDVGADPEPLVRRQERTLERDERDPNGNFLELLEQKQSEIEDLRTKLSGLEERAAASEGESAKAREAEAKAHSEVERMQGLLQDSLARERNLEEQVLKARIESVRAEKELYRARIASLSTNEVK